MPFALVLTNATGLPLTTGITGALPVANGGTGATSAATARSNLSVPGYTMILLTSVAGSPVSGTTYYVGGYIGAINAVVFDKAAVRVPKSGTIKSVNIKVHIDTIDTIGTNQTVNHYIRINDTTDCANIQGNYHTDPLTGSIDNVNQAVSAGDTIALKIVCPTWGTEPTGVWFYCEAYIE